MLKQSFSEVYAKFKLHFYQEITLPQRKEAAA